MAAQCFPCEAGTSTVPGRPRGDPLGTCKRCGALACHGHGDYDPNGPAWQCVHCVPALLTAKAGQAAPSSLVSQLTTLGMGADLDGGDTVEAFVDSLAFTGSDFVERVDDFVDHGAPEVFTSLGTERVWWFELDDREARRFLGAAVLFAVDYDLPDDLLPTVLVPLVRQERGRGLVTS